jgi:hypothetical protein
MRLHPARETRQVVAGVAILVVGIGADMQMLPNNLPVLVEDYQFLVGLTNVEDDVNRLFLQALFHKVAASRQT